MKDIFASSPKFCAAVKLLGYIVKPVLIAGICICSFFIPYACIILTALIGLKLTRLGWNDVKQYFKNQPAGIRGYADGIINGRYDNFMFLPTGIMLLITSIFMHPLYSIFIANNADHYLQTKGFSITPLANLLFIVIPLSVSMITGILVIAGVMLVSKLWSKYESYLIDCSQKQALE